jgi:serpin B
VATFSARVLRHIASGDRSSANLAVSPLFLHAALTLLRAGARGATLDQIVALLGPAGGPAHAALASHVALRMLAADGGGGGPTVRFANAVWVDAALRLTDAYAREVTGQYLAEVRSVPFNSRVSSHQAIGNCLLAATDRSPSPWKISLIPHNRLAY